ncbi:MAG: hypothetical protein QOH86_1161 [Sphingomonadales bacterium]|jgi:hypothetical protein|nr:hypothetical protein [Sphingomonadales bacterium]
MAKRILAAATFLVSVGASGPALAAFDQPAPPAERTYWEVKWDDALCTLTRRHTGEHPVSFSLALAPTSRLLAVQLDFDGPELETRGSKSKLDLLFSPGGESLPLDFTVLHEGGRNNLIAFSNTSWLDRLAAARSIRFGASGRFPVVELGDAAKAVTGLRACLDDMLRAWGVDGAALDALRRLPDLDGPPALGLPMAHLARGQGGGQRRPLSRLEVTADGRVAACRVVLGSRGADTDSKICDLWQRRARFRPALAADGRPVPATIIAEFIWKIP